MAKTKKKEIHTKEEIIEVATVPEMDKSLEGKNLSSTHLLLLETGLRDVEAAKLRVAIESQFLNNLLLEYKLLEVRIEKQKQLSQAKAREYENEKQKFQSVKDEVFKEYGLDGEKFGYDPITGKIIL